MKLVSFSVENYRSITNARKIPLANYSLLVGANNEGKSNILHALKLGMDALTGWQRIIRRTADGRVIRMPPSIIGGNYANTGYNWHTDFPIAKQSKAKENSKTNITLEFSLDEKEIIDFHTEIKSYVNGTLPILIQFSRQEFELSVQKPGKGYATLNKKSTRIADFVSRRIRFEYIPAIRTANSASGIISSLVERELRRLDSNQDYLDALENINTLQKPILEELGSAIHETVASFLPNVKSVKLETRQDARQRALRRDVEILIDDGHETKLERKGDGVQSLVVLALMRNASEQSSADSSTVIAIEEPESHLHPSAIHELREVIEELSENNQIVLSSHSPLFVSVNNLKNTIVVRNNKAKCAEHVSEVRDALGVRFSDNLYNASLVILVEGSDDVKAVRAILSSKSKKIEEALSEGSMTFDYLGGASALSYKASLYRASACQVQCFLDDDDAGRLAVSKAITAKAIKLADVNMCRLPHQTDSEIEDLYDKDIYRKEFIANFGVDPKAKPLAKTKLKWSSAIERLFREAGKPWSDLIKAEIKNWLAEFASLNPEKIVKEELSGPFKAIISTIEGKLPKK